MEQITLMSHARARLPRTSGADLQGLIGQTPMVALTVAYKGRQLQLLAKAEHFNMTGSIKDRVALYILRQAFRTGRCRPGDTIVEASSGNSGLAFAAIGRAMGCKVRIYMPSRMSVERQHLLRSMGAELVLISEQEGGFKEAMRRCEASASEETAVFSPDQFSNECNCQAHQVTTGAEIADQLVQAGLRPDAFIAGVGTGGTIMGVGRALRARFGKVRICAMEVAESPTLSQGRKTGQHRIQGLFDEFVPDILKLSELDQIVQVNDGDAILMAQRLSRELGLGVGLSSGGNLVAAIKLAETMPRGSRIVTVFCDDNKKYLSTDLFREEEVRESYITPYTQFLSFQALAKQTPAEARTAFEYA